MGWKQMLSGIALVVMLLALAGYYAWRQIAILRRVADSDSEESRFQRGLARRRLVNSILMAVLALLLSGALLFLETAAQNLADRQDAREQAGEDRDLTGPDLDFARAYGLYWCLLILVLLAIVVLTGADLWAIRRYARVQFQKLREARRSMIERETARLRAEREEPDDPLRN